MISKTLEKAFNDQINAETYSAYLYWSMSASLEEMRLAGFAKWMRAQAQEEMIHAVKFYHQVIERGGRVKMAALQAPPAEWKSVEAMFEDVVRHEGHVTGLINGLVDLSISEKDHASHQFLQWFVAEQVEEESSVQEVLGKIQLAGESRGGLYMLDKEMGQRVFTAPIQGESQ